MTQKTNENPWTMDVRVRERNLKSGALTDKDLEKFLSALPDLAEQTELFGPPQPALNQPPPPVVEPVVHDVVAQADINGAAPPVVAAEPAAIDAPVPAEPPPPAPEPVTFQAPQPVEAAPVVEAPPAVEPPPAPPAPPVIEEPQAEVAAPLAAEAPETDTPASHGEPVTNGAGGNGEGEQP